nr:type II toxin-antitoxin system RelE/ParE family toxin [Polymorphobacter sp.]
MIEYEVRFSIEAKLQLDDLYDYIAASASPSIASAYIEAITGHCRQLKIFPFRGTPRSDLRKGARTINYRKRCLIVFTVEEQIVAISAIHYGGQDVAAFMPD